MADAGFEFSESLIPTGLGRRMRGDVDRLARDPEALKRLLRRHALLVLTETAMSSYGFQHLLRALSPTATNEANSGGADDLLRLDGVADEDKVVTGRGHLPLHTDGLFLGRSVDVIALLAVKVTGGERGGATVIADKRAAVAAMSRRTLRLMLERGLEYRILEHSYFGEKTSAWHPVPLRHADDADDIGMVFPFRKGEPRGWDLRIPGFSIETTESMLDEAAHLFESARYCHRHWWRSGDLMLIDNRQTVHGRDAIPPGVVRRLVRGQIQLTAT